MDHYWVNNSGDWADTGPSHWASISGGSPDLEAPDATENAIFDASSFTLPGQSVTISQGSDCNGLDISTVTNTPTLLLGSFADTSAGIQTNGDVILSSGMTIASVDPADPGQLGFNMEGSLTTNGAVLGVDIVSYGTVHLADTLTLDEGMILDGSGAVIDFGTQTVNHTQTTDRGYIALDSASILGSATINMAVAGTMGAFRCEDLAFDPDQSSLVFTCATDAKAALFNTHHEVNALSRVPLNIVTLAGTAGLSLGSAKEDSAIVGGWQIAHLTLLPNTTLYLRDQGPSS